MYIYIYTKCNSVVIYVEISATVIQSMVHQMVISSKAEKRDPERVLTYIQQVNVNT